LKFFSFIFSFVKPNLFKLIKMYSPHPDDYTGVGYPAIAHTVGTGVSGNSLVLTPVGKNC